MIKHTFRHTSGQCLEVLYDTATKQYWVKEVPYTLAEMGMRFGLTRVPVARFRNTRVNPVAELWLAFDAQAQRALYQGRWWDAQVLAQYLGIHYAPVMESPPATGKSLKFLEGAKVTGKFTGTKNSRKRKKR